jgi:hypothetical protein
MEVWLRKFYYLQNHYCRMLNNFNMRAFRETWYVLAVLKYRSLNKNKIWDFQGNARRSIISGSNILLFYLSRLQLYMTKYTGAHRRFCIVEIHKYKNKKWNISTWFVPLRKEGGGHKHMLWEIKIYFHGHTHTRKCRNSELKFLEIQDVSKVV